MKQRTPREDWAELLKRTFVSLKGLRGLSTHRAHSVERRFRKPAQHGTPRAGLTEL